jgi:hypothetical protein
MSSLPVRNYYNRPNCATARKLYALSNFDCSKTHIVYLIHNFLQCWTRTHYSRYFSVSLQRYFHFLEFGWLGESRVVYFIAFLVSSNDFNRYQGGGNHGNDSALKCYRRITLVVGRVCWAVDGWCSPKTQSNTFRYLIGSLWIRLAHPGAFGAWMVNCFIMNVSLRHQ